ncbi:MAG: S8 family serine peptidase [bacterium]
MNLAFWLGLVLLGIHGPGINQTRKAAEFNPEPYSSASVIRFANGISIDIIRDQDTKISKGVRYWLIHFSVPVCQWLLDGLRNLNLEPVGYIAYQTVVVRANAGLMSEVKSRLPIDWFGPFLPEYKLSPELKRIQRSRSKVQRPLAVAFWDRRIQPAIFAVSDLKWLIESDDVAWVQEADVFEPFNRDVQWVLQTGWNPVVPDPIRGRKVWEKGIRGQGIIVGLFDSGINTEHDMFRDPNLPLSEPGVYPNHRKIVAYKLYRGADFGDVGAVNYHGSAVCGTLAGNDGVCGNLSDLDGIAPEARIYFLDIASASGKYIYSDNLTEMLDSMRLGRGLFQPIRQISGSVGTSDYLGYYRLAEASVDAVCWQDRKFFVVWGAGNSGGAMYKIGHPAGAKNCLTVGGCGNGVRSNLIYLNSSAGPTRDGRIKPNVVAPAESIWTVWGAGINAYSVRGGTSFAAPAACGALALLRQYLSEGWFPSGQPDPRRKIVAPSSALMRALAISATDTNVGTETIPDVRAGWGRLNLSQIMHFPEDSVTWTFVDETLGLESGRFDEYEVTIDRRTPMRVVLAWTDTAAAPTAQIALVNDLNLELISPDDNRYRGNQLLRGQSVPNPINWDERNVEEVCQLNRPLPGVYKIRIYARNIYTVRQPYALVIKASVAGMSPAVSEQKSQPSGHPWFNHGGRSFLVGGRGVASGLMVPDGARLKLWTVNGRLAADINGFHLSQGFWQFTDEREQPLPAGVYFYQLSLPDRTYGGKLLFVK